MNVKGNALLSLVFMLFCSLLSGCSLDAKIVDMNLSELPSGLSDLPSEVKIEYSSKPYRDYYSKTGRYEHASAVINNNKVVLIGGRVSGLYLYATDTIEIFNAASKHWSDGPNYPVPVTGHTATTLTDGKVLIIGGMSFSPTDNTAQTAVYLYDPDANTLTQKASMATAHVYHSATLLNDGKVLVIGGRASAGSMNGSTAVEVYDPTADTWTTKTSLGAGKAYHTATLLANGKVFIAGGASNFTEQNTTAVYDPTLNTWTAGPNLAAARMYHTATLMDNGKEY